MNNTIKTIIICILTTVSIATKAQDQFGTYTNSLDGRSYDILLSFKKSTDFSLWINAMSLDDKHQLGGILINKDQLDRFITLLYFAKAKYDREVELAKNIKTTELNEPLWLYCAADAFFKDESWNIDFNTELNCDLKITSINGETKHFLIVSTKKLESETNPSISSNGYGLVFGSSKEIMDFISQISVFKIRDYIESRGATTALLKNKDISAPVKYPQLSVGLKIEGDFSLGMNDVTSDKNEKFDASIIKPNLAGGFVAGISSTIEFKRLYIQPEVQYSIGAKNYYIRFFDHKYRIAELKKNVEVSTLDIPLLIGYKVWNYSRGNLRIYAGPKIRLNLGSTISYSHLIYPQTRDFNNLLQINELSTDVKANALGINTGLEFNFEHYAIGLNYNIIGDMYQTKVGAYTIDDAAANSLGITFTLNLFDTKK